MAVVLRRTRSRLCRPLRVVDSLHRELNRPSKVRVSPKPRRRTFCRARGVVA